MQRFFTLVALFLFALPLGLSTTGCLTNVSAFCNGAGYGPKLGTIYSLRLPGGQSATGISLAYGQIGQIATPAATDCRGTTVSTGTPTYGSSNLSMADISPTGGVCAGTWNRLSAGGIPDFTICTPSATAGTAILTASVGGVVSNPVTVYVHPQVAAITINNPTQCYPSQQTTQQNYFVGQTSVYDSDGALISSAGSSTGVNDVGTITYTAQTPDVVTINNTSVTTSTTSTGGTTTTTTGDGSAVANQPGGTVITATIAGTGSNSVGTSSAAGYFYTCPPTSIALSLPGSAGTTATNGAVTITAGNPQTVTATLVDGKNNVSITPLATTGPDYISTAPQQISVNSTGLVTSILTGTATITGICQPGSATASTSTSSTASSSATGSSCNSTPLNKLGTFGTGLPIVANTIAVNSTGADNTKIWAASPQSQQFTPFDLSLGTTSAPILMPYPPNSMLLDPTGTELYFGSYRELMVYSALTNTLATQDISVPGVVLAVSPSNNQVVIADQLRQVIYLYTPATSTGSGTTASTTASSSISIGGVATHAVYSPDGKNVYIVGPTTLYVHNNVSGWSQYPLTSANATSSCALDNTGTTPFCSPDVAITVPSVAAFVSGNPAIARSFCPDTTTSPVTYNPLADTLTGDASDHLAATANGAHILGANTTTFFDAEHTPSSASDTSALVAPTGPCPGITAPAGPLAIQTTLHQLAFAGITPTQIDQVLTSPDSSRAFVTYMANAATGVLPLYTPSATANSTGTLSYIQLASGAEAPIAGVFSPDSTLFFTSTTGDNLIHVINTGTGKDTEQLNPQLTNGNGELVPAQFLVTAPRATT